MLIDKIRTRKTHLLFFSNDGFVNEFGGRFVVIRKEVDGNIDPYNSIVYANVNRCDLRGYVSVFQCLDNKNIFYHYQHKDPLNYPNWGEMISAWIWAEKDRMKKALQDAAF